MKEAERSRKERYKERKNDKRKKEIERTERRRKKRVIIFRGNCLIFLIKYGQTFKWRRCNPGKVCLGRSIIGDDMRK